MSNKQTTKKIQCEPQAKTAANNNNNMANALPRKPNTATTNEKQNGCNKQQSRKIKKLKKHTTNRVQ